MVFKNGIGNGNKNHTTQISLLPTVISLLISLLSSLLRSLLPTQILLLPAQFHCYR